MSNKRTHIFYMVLIIFLLSGIIILLPLNAKENEIIFNIPGTGSIIVALKNDPVFGRAEKIERGIYKFYTPSGYTMTVACFDAKSFFSGMSNKEIKESLQHGPEGTFYETDDYFYLFYTLKRDIEGKPAIDFFTRGIKGNVLFGFEIKIMEDQVTEAIKSKIDDLYKKAAAGLEIVHTDVKNMELP